MVMVTAALCALLCGCGDSVVVSGGGAKGMNDWKRGTVTASYTLEELLTCRTKGECEIKADERHFEDHYSIKVFTFQEYWNVPCKEETWSLR